MIKNEASLNKEVYANKIELTKDGIQQVYQINIGAKPTSSLNNQ